MARRDGVCAAGASDKDRQVGVIIVLMGMPGAGKGTQARLLAERFGWPKISTGDILREIAETETELGRIVRETQKAGQLVSDEILAEILRERTAQADCQRGYVLDGYPRTAAQAAFLEELANAQGKRVLVINIAVSRESLTRRLAGRRSCPQCGEIYNLWLKPPREDEQCDRCRVPLVQRADDVPEAIEKRYDVYREKTAPLLEYYRQRGAFFEVDGERSIEEIFEQIEAIVRREINADDPC
ncbi:MAG: adenylate kinase [Blastocatellia bacterium]|nr:adenylate kinase [Blastocatellia bacterium]MCS7157522.1 adenylate kinase [Blastocatellia bacterium]MCX7752695.1 adenylate kinase [Blastocatellia bacterium]MDW8168427.1 adenylate kinase [Acidobacteriota bacterium]MDW8255622.1 adenylate kinase [Acidobacteriota bacterium]